MRFQGGGYDVMNDLPGGGFYVRKIVPGGSCSAAFSTTEAMQLLADITRLAELDG